MVRRSLDPWLAHVLRAEITLVLDWWRNVCNGIKPDPESRFSNDYSNFRSVLETSPASNHMVQLIEVLTLDETPVVVLSDSERKIKARLSREAVAAFEAETEEKLSLDVTGDVFHLRKFTVISTDLSISEDYVQLFVDSIDYAHHLRRTEGNPQPIVEDQGISPLIKDIERLRSSEYSHNSQDDVPSSQRPESGPSASIAVPRSSPLETQQSIPPLQSQYQPSKRATGPSLAKDGFSIESGLNLEMPFQGLAGLSRHERLPGIKPSDTNDERRDRLLGILGVRPKDDLQVPRQAMPPPSSNLVSETPAKHIGLTSQISLDPPRADPKTRSSQDLAPSSTIAGSPQASRTDHIPSAQSETVLHELEPEPAIVAMSSVKVVQSAQLPQLPILSPQVHNRFRSPPSRRKIPVAQRKLLDHPSSWFPSLPGQRFPHPNVPVELLKAWNTSMTKTSSPKHATPGKAETRRENMENELPHSSNMSAEEDVDSSDDEPLNASQWPPSQPPTPSQRRPDLPPDSSFNSPTRGEEDELRIAAPRTLPVRRSPHRPDRQTAPLPQSVPMRQPLPARAPSPVPAKQLPTRAAQESPRRPGVHDSLQSSPRSVLSQISASRERSSQQVPSSSRDSRAQGVSARDTPKHQSIRSLPPPQTTPLPRSELPASRSRPPSREIVGRQYERDIETPIPIQSSVYPDYWKPSYGNHGGLPQSSYNDHERPSASNTLSPWRNRPMVGRRSFPSQTSPAAQQSQQENDLSSWKSVNGTPSSQRSTTIREPQSRYNGANGTLNGRSSPRTQDPDDTHRHARREFVQQQKRKRDMERSDWLKSRYHPSTYGNTRFQTALAEYRRSHESDQSVSAQDFMKAAQIAYPASNVTLGTLFSPYNREEDKNEIAATSHQTSKLAQAPRNVVSQNGVNGQAHRSSHGDYSGSKLENNVPASTVNEGQDIMKEFCDNWLNIRPGGAFAVALPQRPARRHVNILAWDV